MLDPIHAATHENLQLGEGVLLRGADLDAALLSADPVSALIAALEDASYRIGATKAGCIFRCVPQLADTTGGHRTPAAGEILAGRWEVTLSGTLMEITPANAALLLNVPPYMHEEGRAILQPEPTPVPNPCEDVCWVGDTGSGLLAIQLRSPVSTGGMVFRATRNGLGEAAFTLMAQKTNPADPGLPCRLLWLKEASA